tara:strand:- start:749 stop:982 length:234 start_codon:yes stop_codon:yes gene_type:complete
MSTITFKTKSNLALKQLRESRNALLKESDWMANSDVEMSSAWTTYRQALRDLPDGKTPTLNETGDTPTNVVFPTPPE